MATGNKEKTDSISTLWSFRVWEKHNLYLKNSRAIKLWVLEFKKSKKKKKYVGDIGEMCMWALY